MEAEIDAVMVKIFELMEKYLEHRRRLQELMKNGFFELTQAKQNMGMNGISQLQYDKRMKATSIVNLKNDEGEKGLNEFSLILDATQNLEDKSSSLEEVDNSFQGNPKDPLKWFGVLVSPHLRNSQADFKKTLPEILMLSNMTLELNSLYVQYDQLIEEKKRRQKS